MFASLSLALLIVGYADDPGPDAHCGSHCLYLALKSLDVIDVVYGDFEKSMPEPGKKGYSMLELQNAATARGLQVLPVKTTLPNLGARKEPLICLTSLKVKGTDMDHYVIIYDHDEDNVYLADPPRDYTLPVDTFKSVWSGNALLIAKSPLATEESLRSGRWLLGSIVLVFVPVVAFAIWGLRRGRRVAAVIALTLLSTSAGCGGGNPDLGVGPTSTPARKSGGRLIVSPPSHDIGRIPARGPVEEVETVTVLRNDGEEPLDISEVSKSCGCTTVALESSHLEPGATTRLVARLRVGNSPERKRAGIVVVSSDRIAPRAEIGFEWQVVNRFRTEPEVADIGRIEPGKEGSARLGLTIDGMDFCRDCRVVAKTQSHALECIIQSGDESSREAHEPVRPRLADGWSLMVRALPLEDAVVRNEVVGLAVVCRGEERARYDLPVNWRVGRLVEVSPERVFLGHRSPGDEAAVHLLVRSSQNVPFRILKVGVEDSSGELSAKFGRKPESFQAVDVRLKIAKAMQWRSHIIISTDEPSFGDIRIPISYMSNLE